MILPSARAVLPHLYTALVKRMAALIEKTSALYKRRLVKEIRNSSEHGVYFHREGESNEARGYALSEDEFREQGMELNRFYSRQQMLEMGFEKAGT